MTDVDTAVLAPLADSPLRALLLVALGALLEGSVVTVTAAALAGAGLLPWWGVWLTAACADVVADTLFYGLGRHGGRGRSRRLLARFGLTDERRDALAGQVHARLPQVVVAAKLVDVGAVPAFLAAGLARVRLRRFLAWVVPTTVVRSGVLVGIGALAGDRFAEDLTERPWLLAVGGLAVAVLLVAARWVIGRLSRPAGPPARSPAAPAAAAAAPR